MEHSRHPGIRMPRRQFLKMTAGTAAIVGTAAACGGSTQSATTNASAGSPKRGGTLTAALTGGDSSDTLDGQNAVNNVDFARVAQLFDTLLVWSPGVVPQPSLAEEMVPNADATEWVIRLRQGIVCHDGKDFTSADVIYSFQRILNPKKPLAAAVILAPIDVAGLKAVDKYTVKVPCKTPFASFRSAAANQGIYMVPAGFDPNKPNGTGPFKFHTFTPGQTSTFVRNENYWQSGLPYLDAVIMTDFADQTSQLNALDSGQAQIVNLLSADAISGVQSGGNHVLISPGGGAGPLTMRVDQPPFNDVRVRQAMRLIVDRPQMRDLVFGGHGEIANDIFSVWDPEYDHSLPQRHQDLEQAKFLLKAAGQEGLTVQLTTSNISQGSSETAQVFAQQAKGAGVNVQLQQLTVTNFFTGYLKFLFAEDFWFYSPYLIQVAETIVPGAYFNPTHWNNARYNSLYAQALQAVDPQRQTEIVHEMMTIDYNEGGYIIPLVPPVIDGYSARFHGAVPSKTGISFNNYDLRRSWLD